MDREALAVLQALMQLSVEQNRQTLSLLHEKSDDVDEELKIFELKWLRIEDDEHG